MKHLMCDGTVSPFFLTLPLWCGSLANMALDLLVAPLSLVTASSISATSISLKVEFLAYCASHNSIPLSCMACKSSSIVLGSTGKSTRPPRRKVLLFFIRPAGKAIIIIFLFSAVSRPQEVSLQHLIIITGNIEVNVSRKLQITHPTSLRPRVLTNLGGLDGIPLWIAGTMPQPLRNAHSNMPRLVSRYLIAIYCLA